MAFRWAFLVCVHLLPAPVVARSWTDDTGTFRAEAELAGFENGRVLLKRPEGGAVIRIPLDRLSKADREFLDQSGAYDTSDPSLPHGVDAEAIQKADDALKDQIKDELAAAKTPAKREKLVGKLLEMAASNRADKASQFVLLRKAAEMAAALGEAQAVVSAMSDLEALVRDSMPAWNKVLAALDTHHPIQDSSLLVDKLDALIGLAIAKDDYDTAIKYCNLLLTIGRQEKDIGLQAAVRTRIGEANAAKEEWKRIAAVKEKLKQDPADEEANRAMGRFLVIYKGDFEHGLPLLAASDDTSLKAVAVADLKEKKSTAEMLSVGDAWLNVAKSVTPRTAAQERGAYWYLRARHLLDFAERRHIDAKLDPLLQREWIDLSAKVEFPRDQIVNGYWVKEGHTLSSASPGDGGMVGLPGFGAMAFPVVPSRTDYELAIEIECVSQGGLLFIAFPVAQRMCSLAFARNGDGLELIDGKDALQNATTVKPSIMRNGRRVSVRITVDVQDDQAQICVFVDRQRYIAWQGKSMSVDFHAGRPGHLNIILQPGSNFIFPSAKLLNK